MQTSRRSRATAPGGRREFAPSPPGGGREFRHDLSRRLAHLRTEIASLESKLGHFARPLRVEYLELLRDLDARARRLETRLETATFEHVGDREQFEAASEATWRNLKRMLLRVALSIRSRTPETTTDKADRRPRR